LLNRFFAKMQARYLRSIFKFIFYLLLNVINA